MLRNKEKQPARCQNLGRWKRSYAWKNW